MADITKDLSAVEGETLRGSFTIAEEAGRAFVRLVAGSTMRTIDCAVNGETADFSADSAGTDGLAGRVRWYLYVERGGSIAVEAMGSINVIPLVSRYRRMLEACEAALASYAANANKQVSVGELSITYKDREELLGLIGYYRSRAEAEEAGGNGNGGGIRRVLTRFA